MGSTIVLPRSSVDLDAMIAAASAPLLVCLPSSRWSLLARVKLRRRGIPFILRPVDPWSFPADALVVAHGDDAAVAVAGVRGQAVKLVSDGRFGTRARGTDLTAVAAHVLSDTVYRDPFDGNDISAFETIEILRGWRRQIDANRDIATTVGIAWWKRAEMRTFLWTGGRRAAVFSRSEAAAIRSAVVARGAVAAWPSRISAGLRDRCSAAGVPMVTIEDGFIRSVGLGTNLHPPYSVTLDTRGAHFDPRTPSDLEHIIETGDFPPDLLARAAALRRLVVDRGISKYGGLPADLPPRQPGRRLILVTGQVSDDLSVRCGGHDVEGNLDLLARSRALEPESEIWFRPHPDVDTGHRRGAIDDAAALGHADRVVRGGGMAALLDRVDGVHVLTSLSGFEALLRGRDVTAHGSPFYAGWGLTRDVGSPIGRRTRRPILDELVAATLIVYPRYLDPVTFLPCEVEQLVSRLSDQIRPRRTWLTVARSVQGKLMRRHG